MKLKHYCLINRLMVLFLIILLCSCGDNFTKKHPVASKGIIDLRNWDFEKDGLVEIKGEMEFYWKKMITPTEFNKYKLTPDLYIKVPGMWNNYKINNKNIPATGYGTYRLLILMPDKKIYTDSDINKNNNLELRIGSVYSAYNCWFNNLLVLKKGNPSINQKEFIGEKYPEIVHLNVDTDKLYLTINVSNYFFSQGGGGFSQPIYIGLSKNIFSINQKKIFFYHICFGIFLIMFIYHFWFWILRKKELHFLYFSFICLLMSIQSIFTIEQSIYYFFPDFNLELYYKIWYMVFGLFPLSLMYYKQLYPNEVKKIFVNISLIIFSSCIFLDIILPTIIFTKLIPFYYFSGILIMIYLLIANLFAIKNKRDLSVLFFIGLLIPVLTGINDCLYSINIIQTSFLTPIGILFYMILQSYSISLKFTRSFNQVEILTLKLEDMNMYLEDKVEKRTQSLQNAKNVIEQKNHEILEQKQKLEQTFEELTKAHKELFKINYELSDANEKLTNLATRDPLTEIANKRLFYEVYNYEWKKALRSKSPISIIFIDVDFFKLHNDTYGHLQGDEVLRKIGALLSKVACRASDLAARYGGEEFIVILTNTDMNGALIAAERIRKSVIDLNIEHKTSTISSYLSVSIGVSSIIPDNKIEPELLIKTADQALYKSKESGRNCVNAISPDISMD